MHQVAKSLGRPSRDISHLTLTSNLAACQRADWPKHKVTCRSLKGGTWQNIHLRLSMPGMDAKYMAHINHHTSTLLGLKSGTTIQPADGSAPPPPNTYGDRPFLMKLQIGLSGVGQGASMMLYDRTRSERCRRSCTRMTTRPRLRSS